MRTCARIYCNIKKTKAITVIAYQVTNLKNGKRYIGITRQSVSARWAAHIRAAHGKRKSSSAIQAAIRKRGPEAFSVKVIAQAKTWDDLVEIERALILQEGTTRPAGYNIMPGGEGGPTMLGRKLTADQLVKLSVAKLATWASFTPERRAEISRNMVAGQATRTRGPIGPTKSRGVPKSAKHRANIGVANKRRYQDDAEHVKTSVALKASPKAKAYHASRIGIAPVASAVISAANSVRWAAMTPERRAEIGRNIAAGKRLFHQRQLLEKTS